MSVAVAWFVFLALSVTVTVTCTGPDCAGPVNVVLAASVGLKLPAGAVHR
jgi:hypothetical protein